MFVRIFALGCAAALAACSQQAAPLAARSEAAPAGGAWSINPGPDLNAFFECLEKDGATLVSAHRGGPRAGFPENALETMAQTMTLAPALMEVDVATSADGVLYLMHDDDLARTTTGEGGVDALAFADIEALFLEDNDGARTPYHPTRLDAALDFAKSGAILQIDFKRTTRFEAVIAAIRAAGAQDRVILIAYSLSMAQKLARLAPEMMISLSMDEASDLDAAVAARLKPDRLLAFTGLEAPNAPLYDALNARDVEVIFGTLGRDGVDAAAEALGDDRVYVDFAEIGVDILATDRPVEADAALRAAGRAPVAGRCGVSRSPAE